MKLPRERRPLILGMIATIVVSSGLLACSQSGVQAGSNGGAQIAPDGRSGSVGARAVPGGVRWAAGAAAVPDSYLVVLKETAVGARAGTARAATALPARARTLAGTYGATVERTYAAALTGFAATMTAGEAARLAADPAVAYVEQNRTVSIDQTQSDATWGLDRVDQRGLPLSKTYTYPTTATSVHAYVIDTGVLTTHNEFRGRASSGYDFVDNDSDATDCHGHGTHVAGTIGGATYGVAKEVQIVAVRVLGCTGGGTLDGVVAGIDWVTAHAIKPAVANMSLGGGASSALNNAVENSIAAGVTYGVAAGNSGDNACNYSPASAPSAITVGATTNTDQRASYSNYGTCLDIFAPGSSITSAWNTSTTATNTINGTSMATPHVVGAAALVLAANPSYTPVQVRNALVSNSTTNVVTSPGTGSANRLLFVVN